MKICYLFPGQGSQEVGMGAELFEDFPELVQQADDILGYPMTFEDASASMNSLTELCLKNPEGLLNQTKYTQPALYTVSSLAYLKKIRKEGNTPDFVAGHSLGEYTALFVAGAFDFQTGLKLVQKRAELMSECSGGGMAAIIGMNTGAIEEILKDSKNDLAAIDIANYNAPLQTVISGPVEAIQKAKKIFKSAKCKYIPLKVSGAFHSRSMLSAQEKFAQFLKNFKFSKLEIPVISNVKARPYKSEAIKDLLTQQLSHSVRWTESMLYLLDLGVKDFSEVGPGQVLTNLLAKVQKAKIKAG